MTATIHQFFNWRFSAQIRVTNPSADPEYQSVIDLPWRPGMQPGFEDIRFFDQKGQRLPYWIESKTDRSVARVWIRGATDRAITLLFGNPDAKSESDGLAVFEIFDDFSAGSLDTVEKWSLSGSPAVAIVDGVLRVTGKNSTTDIVRSQRGFSGAGYALLMRSRFSAAYGSSYFGIVDAATANFGLCWDTAGWRVASSRGGTISRDSQNPITSFSTVEFRWISDTDLDVYINNTRVFDPAAAYCPLSTATLYVTLRQYGNGYVQYHDWIAVRKCAATEPTLTAAVATEPNPYSPQDLAADGLLIFTLSSRAPADIEILYDIEIGSTGKDLKLLYHLLRARDVLPTYHIEILKDLDTLYQIEVLKDLQTSYHILIKREAVLPYDIPGGVTFTLVYSIEATAVLDYRINVGDQVYDPERFWDLVITRKLNQVHTAEFSLWTEGADVSGVREGETIRILYNDEVRFSGEIRSIQKDDMSGIWTISCESGACRLADDAVQGVLDYRATPGDQILRAVLPGPAWVGEIDPGPAVDYRQEYTDILSHVVNLANVMGHDWRVRQQEDRYQVTARTETTITVAGAGWPTSPPALVGRVVVVMSGAAKFRAGIVTSHTADTLSFSGTSWVTDGLKPGDAIRIFGPFRLDVKKRIGSETPRKTFVVNRDIFESSTARDIERVANAIVVPGTASITQDRKSVISGNTLLMTPIAVTEAILRLSISSTSDVIPVDSTAGFPPSGTVQIDRERIAYISKTATTFEGLTRGYAGTQPAAHNLQTEVVLVSEMPVESTAGFPASGAIWVGMEKIEYTSLSPTSFRGLTRGTGNTEIYAHRAGVLARCAAYTDESPQPGSSIALYGIRRRVVPALGVLDQNTLDILAQEQLLALQDMKVWGSGTVPAPAFLEDIDVGDEIAIAPEAGGDPEAYRLVGIVWRQMNGEIEIEYGTTREYFLEDLNRLQKGIDVANARGAVAMLGTVISVSSNGEVAEVLLDDGTTVWARIR